MANKFYAVKVGLKPGIYRSWAECEPLVRGYPNASFKSFVTEREAVEFMGGEWCTQNDSLINTPENAKDGESLPDHPATVRSYAFVDGSFNSKTGVYGYGGFVVHKGEKYIVTGCGSDADMASMRNVAGEVLGSIAAVKKALELGLRELDLYYDYSGIEMWAVGAWKRNKKGTIAYYEYMQSVKDRIKLNFIKVKGHSGIEGNEEADLLAKKAVGILS